MKHQAHALRGALYRLFDLPAAEHDEALYQTLVAQRRANAEKLLAAAGLRERSAELLAAIAARAPRRTITLTNRVRTPRRGRLFLLAGAAAAAVLAVVLLLPVETAQRDGLTITAWSGQPRIIIGGKSHPAAQGRTVGRDGVISTGSGGSLTLAGEGHRFSLGADTTVRITRLDRATHFDAVLTLDRGAAAFAFAEGKRYDFVVQTARGAVSVTGTVFAVAVDDARLRVVVRRGRVLYRAAGDATPQPLVAGQGLSVGTDGQVRLGDVSADDAFVPLTGLLDRISPPLKKPQPPPATLRPLLREKKQPLGGDQVPAATSGQVRVHLKNGSTIRGSIIHDEPGQIRVRTGFGVMNVNRDTIERIEKMEQ